MSSVLYSKLCKSPHQCGVCIGQYTLSSRQGLRMGCHITKGVSERCVARLLLTLPCDFGLNVLRPQLHRLRQYFSCTECLVEAISADHERSCSIVFLFVEIIRLGSRSLAVLPCTKLKGESGAY